MAYIHQKYVSALFFKLNIPAIGSVFSRDVCSDIFDCDSGGGTYWYHLPLPLLFLKKKIVDMPFYQTKSEACLYKFDGGSGGGTIWYFSFCLFFNFFF